MLNDSCKMLKDVERGWKMLNDSCLIVERCWMMLKDVTRC